MKYIGVLVWGLLAFGFFVAGVYFDRAKPFTTDPQFASGEWKIEMQTPPCDAVHNLQVIWPKEPRSPITIECDSMPVPTR